MSGRYLITGATGFVGGHVVEACVQRGIPWRTIARPASDISRLKALSGEIIPGDLNDPDILEKASEDIEVVVHCAAKVGDWGPVSDYRQTNVDSLEKLISICRKKPVRRFVHLSSLGVYEARHHYQSTEETPMPALHLDGYTQSKVEAERLLAPELHIRQIPIVILRPGFIYGPRDRTVLPTIVKNLQRKVVRYVSGGKYALNTTFVLNLVDAIFLAIEKPIAVGNIYNITDGEFVSKKRFFETVANGLQLPRPGMGGPLWIAKRITRWVEGYARSRQWAEPPRLTMARLKFLGLNLDFSIEKAKAQLGYRPRYNFEDGMKMTLDWYRDQITSPH